MTTSFRPGNSPSRQVSTFSGEPQLSVDELELDPENPRLPEALTGASESEILKWLNREAVLNELAASMVEIGFFPHEPIIALEDARPNGRHLVLEGNRRFAALAILLQLPAAAESGLQFDFDVQPTSTQLDRLRTVPCFLVESRSDVRKYLGFRHIGGVRTWSPEAKARYLDEEVGRLIAAGSQNAFRDVGRLVGSNAAGVRGPYIALHILRAAREEYGIDTNYVMQDRFGVWNRMMNSRDLRNYIGFGSAATTVEVAASVLAMKSDRLAEVLGDLTPADGQRLAVLSDSRDVTVYAAVLQNERARATLRTYLDLSLARQIVEGANIGNKILNLVRSVELLVKNLDTAELGEAEVDTSRGLLNQARTLHAAIKDRVGAGNDD